jgi:signal transduction histidine kinase
MTRAPSSKVALAASRWIRVADPDLRIELQVCKRRRLIEPERMSEIGIMACSISHDMRHSLTAIYANAEFLERPDLCASTRTDLLLEIQEAVLAMTERIDSLLQFGRSRGNHRLVHERVSLVVKRAIAVVKRHPDGRNVPITVGRLMPAQAHIDARNLESAIFNLLLNACQAATRSTHVPEVKVHLTEVEERIYVTISDNGPGIPASVRKTLFDPFVTAGKPNGTGLGLTLALRIARDHGGSVRLQESNRGRTVFTLSLAKDGRCSSDEPKTGRPAAKTASRMQNNYPNETAPYKAAETKRNLQSPPGGTNRRFRMLVCT